MKCYGQQVSSEEAVRHWMDNTSLISKKSKQVTMKAGQCKQEWTDHQESTV